MPYIQRAITPILKQRVSTSKCMLLVGARQVGKSTLIKHEFQDFNRANFDDRLTRMQAKEEPKLFFLNNPQPLFIDEVQKESSILEDIKQIADESDERGMFILSGSQKLELMKGTISASPSCMSALCTLSPNIMPTLPTGSLISFNTTA